jgi:PDZ domain/Aspartyl protease
MMTSVRTTLAAVLTAALAFAASPAPAADRVAELLAASRAALGGDALNGTTIVATQGSANQGGVVASARTWNELGAWRFAESIDAGPFSQSDGYDGHDAWTRDAAGVVWVDGGVPGRAQEITQAYLSNYLLWRPDRGGATVEDGGTKTDGGLSYDVLSVTIPDVAAPSEIWLDAKTHLPMRAVQTLGPVTYTETFSDYRPANGIMLAYHVVAHSDVGNDSDSTISQVALNPPGAGAQLDKPHEALNDYSIAGGARETSVPIELIDNHVYLNVMLNGMGPYHFLFDTGGLNGIDPAVAKEIGSASHGTMQGQGVGDQTQEFSFSKVDTLQFGAATLRDQSFVVIPTRSAVSATSSAVVDGLIGFEVLSRFVTTFDYANKRVVFQLPAVAHISPQAKRVPFQFDGRTPRIACALDGIDSVCSVDTGARNSISVLAPFAAAHPQLAAAGTSAVGVDGFGVGGPALGKLARLNSLRIGDFELRDLVADLSVQQKGAFASPYAAANIGGAVWKRFSVTFDYPQQTLWLEPNASFADRDAHERAGLFLARKSDAIVVLDVRPGTPAAAAGIAKGDVIASVDGKPAATLGLGGVRSLLYGAAGTNLLVGLGGATPRQVTLTLRDYI